MVEFYLAKTIVLNLCECEVWKMCGCRLLVLGRFDSCCRANGKIINIFSTAIAGLGLLMKFIRHDRQ